jgi:hypothetical protein
MAAAMSLFAAKAIAADPVLKPHIMNLKYLLAPQAGTTARTMLRCSTSFTTKPIPQPTGHDMPTAMLYKLTDIGVGDSSLYHLGDIGFKIIG